MRMEKSQTEILSALRFPLIVGVVLIHSRITDVITQNGIVSISGDNYPFYAFLSVLISNVFSRVSVPLFLLSPDIFSFIT